MKLRENLRKAFPFWKLRRSLSSRISLWVVLIAAVLLIIPLGQLWRSWAQSIRNEVDKDTRQVLENSVMRVNSILESAEQASDNITWLIEQDIDHPELMSDYVQQLVRNNPVLNSASISFEPYFYPDSGKYYSVYAYRGSDGDVHWEQEGDDTYQYFYLNWYLLPKLLNRPCWTEPYADLDPEEDKQSGTFMAVSYCHPFYTRDSTYAGSVSVDLSLKWLSDTMNNVMPFPEAYSILVGHGGTYLAHPDPEKLFYQTLFTDGLLEDDPEKYELGQAMRRGESGYRLMTLGGKKSYVFFRPIQANGWSVAIVCPEQGVYGDFFHMRRIMRIILALSLLLTFFLFGWLIRKQLSPLRELASEADYIASGNLDHPLEPLGREDEIGTLNQSFRNMQSSLIKHIDDLTAATATRERMARELQIARNIQMGMVPHDFPSDLDLYGAMTPAREVGGDLYDFFIQDGKVYVCVGDVSGKGIPASLFMAVSRGMFRILARQGLAPAEIAHQVNQTLSEENQEMLFVTLFFAVIDLASGVMDYCNCGHNPPVIIPANGKAPHFLACKSNTVIGVMEDFAFEGQQVKNMHGKALLLYTDGLNEAENGDHEQFGNDRMLAEIGREPYTDARSLVERLEEAVKTHVAGAEASDDLTMLCVRV